MAGAYESVRILAGLDLQKTWRAGGVNQLMRFVERPSQQLIHPSANRIARRAGNDQIHGSWLERVQAQKLRTMNSEGRGIIKNMPQRQRNHEPLIQRGDAEPVISVDPPYERAATKIKLRASF